MGLTVAQQGAAEPLLSHPEVGALVLLLQKAAVTVTPLQIQRFLLRHFLQKVKMVEWASKYKCQNFNNRPQQLVG